jgi:HSP20 family molecular chaperone IbpA
VAEGAAPRQEGQPGQEPTRDVERYVAPPVDIYEDDQGLVVLADLPGVDPSGLDVQVDRGILTITGRAAHQAQGHPIHREYELRGFFRQVQLSEEIDTQRIAAELKHGVLTLRLPRVERAQPQRIQVKVT